MSKYYLVASYFDGRNFYDEEIIKNLAGVNLDKLNTIDVFTSSHSLLELFSLMESELGVSRRNQLSIKCLKNKDATPNYYRVIVDDKNYLEAVLGMKEVSYRAMDKKRKALSIRGDSELYQQERQFLIGILNTRDISLFDQIYPYSNQFSYLVHRYLETDYDDVQVMNNDYQMIMDEFSNYKTFRYWYILRNKNQHKKENRNFIIFKRNVSDSNKKKKTVKSIQECEEEFEKKFYEKNHMLFEDYEAISHNLAYLDEDKEEYLDVDEVERMYNHHQRR